MSKECDHKGFVKWDDMIAMCFSLVAIAGIGLIDYLAVQEAITASTNLWRTLIIINISTAAMTALILFIWWSRFALWNKES